MSQMAMREADGGDMQTVYGSGSVWQVHHSVIKGHIITYNKACMTIAGKKKAAPLRVACCVLQFLSACFLFLFASSSQMVLSAADVAGLCCVRGFVSTLFKRQ